MPAELIDFTWEAPAGGCRWVKIPVLDRERLHLVDGSLFGPRKKGSTVYRPFDHSGLFREFAGTDLAPEAIAAFADRFGFLGEGNPTEIPVEGGRKSFGMAESAELWIGEILSMRLAVDLWDAARARDAAALREKMVLKGSRTLGFELHLASETPALSAELGFAEAPRVTWSSGDPDLVRKFQAGNLFEPALRCVQWLVNTHLEDRVSPSLHWDSRLGALRLRFVPTSLIGALWLQFALAIDGDRRYRRCEVCGTWFEISPDVARVNKIYCSDRCRAAAYRERQERARALHSQGVPLERIAQDVGSDVETVAGWIAKGGSPNR